MLRNFECWQCHQRFEADDQKLVECPYCHSDNVDYAHFHFPKGTWKWAGVVITCLVVGYALYNINWKALGRSESSQVVSEPKTDTAQVAVNEVTDTAVVNEIGLTVQPTVNLIGKPKFEDGGYSISVKVKNAPPEGTYYVVVLDHYDYSKVIARSDDGNFTKLPPSKNEGQYDFSVCSKQNDSLLCQPVPRPGFLLQQAVNERKGKEWLQQLINTNSDLIIGIGKTPYVAPNYVVHLYGDEVSSNTLLAEIANNVFLGIWSATVTKLEYDDMNRISVIHILVKNL